MASLTLSAALIAKHGANKVSPEALRDLPVPDSTMTYPPISRYILAQQSSESLSFRRLSVVTYEYAVSADGYRFAMPETARFYLHLDEFYSFTSAVFASLLAEYGNCASTAITLGKDSVKGKNRYNGSRDLKPGNRPF